jgi:DNA (cytosine-5)-methyltransferase 1
VLENVSAILANGLDTVLGELAEAGFDAEWACIPASAVGACHHRNRWWCVAYANNTGVEAPRAKQQPAGIEQYGKLAAHATSTRLERRWACGSTAKQLCPDWGGYTSKPVLCRGDDGLSNRVERLKALGNAVVPQVAAIPLARVRQLAGV